MSEQLGRYIVIEGNDGTGKSTQVELLADHFRDQNNDVVLVEEPGSDEPSKSTPFANYLRTIIKNGELARDPEINLALFSAARHELWQAKIAPALGHGAVVLSARNYFSTLAYQGKGEGLDESMIIDATSLATNPRYMRPDDMLILTLDDETERAKRIASRGELETPDAFESRDQEFQTRVNRAYIELAEQYGITTINCGTKSREQIQSEIRTLLGL